MDRRSSLKGLFVLATVGLSSFTCYKWFTINSLPDRATILKKKNLIAELAEMIIPRTDTPGAKDAKVEDFIMDMLEFCTDAKTQNNFLKGLDDLEDYTMNNYGKTFVNCNHQQQVQIMEYFEQHAVYSINFINKVSNKLLGKHFFVKLKELTVEGYCTSEAGATRGLAYDYIPSTYEACVPLTKNQRSWATK